MLPACRTEGDNFTLPTFDVVPTDVEGFMDELQEFQATFHDCFTRSEPRAHFFDYMVGQCSALERKSIEPMALWVDGGKVRGLQRFLSGCDRSTPKELCCPLSTLSAFRRVHVGGSHRFRSQVPLMDGLPDATQPDHP